MPFPYYQRLSARDRAIYRRSDAIPAIEVPAPERFRPAVQALQAALQAGERAAVERAANALTRGLLAALKAPPLSVRVLARRPSDETAELHGLYVRPETGRPTVQLWMRTAAHGRVVAWRTFSRTLLHELCHHLDYDLLGLEDSFHTEGFFRRESSLARQLLPPRTPAAARPPRRRPAAAQLALPLGGGAPDDDADPEPAG